MSLFNVAGGDVLELGEASSLLHPEMPKVTVRQNSAAMGEK